MRKLIAILVSLALVVAACGAPSEPPPSLKSIAETAADAGVFGVLLDALDAAGLAETFADDEAGPYTVFAPTDTAFAALIAAVNELFDLELEGAADLIEAVGIEYVADVLAFHVVAGRLMAADVIAEESLDTLLGEPLAVLVDDDGVQVGTDVTGIYANVTDTDIEATNGVIHVIDFVLLPYLPEIEEELPTIAEIAVTDGRFETLVAALTAADLVDLFADAEAGPFTVFAPTDDAFDALPEGTLEALLGDIPALTNILQYHVLDGVLMASDVLDAIDAGGGSASVTTLQGSDIVATLGTEGVVLNGEVNVIITDIVASNGVIHVIDAVLLPAEELPTIAEIAVTDGRFETLVAALTAADLVDLFADAEAGPFTVFAPTDDAFDALPEGTLEALLGDIPALTNILQYHVLDGVLMASDVLDAIDAGGGSASVTTLQGSDIVATLGTEGVVLNGEVNVIITDIVASNGVIHVIDAVLLPADNHD